jgi:hypothetical protein
MVRTLTSRELNRAMLARQSLLKRSRLSIPKLVDRMAGVQAQYAPAMYVGLWSRLEGLKRESVTRALRNRAIVQGTLLRSTIHLVSASDYWPWAVAIRDSRRQWWLRVRPEEADEAKFFEAAVAARGLLSSGPRSAAELEATLGRDRWMGVGLWIDLVRVPPSGTWEKRRADLYADAELWIPPAAISPPAARAHLVRRYLGGFGPATLNDIASWSGLTLNEVKGAVAAIDVRRFRSEEGKELVDLPRAPLPDGDVTAPVRFLHVWDAMLLVHARRTGVLREEHRPVIFSAKNPQSLPTFLVDGVVAGSWRFADGQVELTPFDPIPRPWKRDLEDEARALAAFHVE